MVHVINHFITCTMVKPKSERARVLREGYALKGLCMNCGTRPPKKGRKLCSGCLENSKRSTSNYRSKHPNAFRDEYQKRKVAGVCTSCGVPGKPLHNGGCQCSDCSLVERQRAVQIKYKVMQKYGGSCACCGETRIAFLTIDHVNNDGAEKRKAGVHSLGGGLYKKLLRLPVDLTLQVSCYNCNCGRKSTGVCPHKDNSFYEAALARTPYERHK